MFVGAALSPIEESSALLQFATIHVDAFPSRPRAPSSRGFHKPCPPTLSDKAPSGPLWIHEIKHDGYRIVASKNGDRVRMWSRNGRDWSREFLAVAEAVRALRADDMVLDGEAMAHCKDGLPDGLRAGA